MSVECLNGGDVLGNVKTALGNGRFVLSWEANENDLLGLMVFQRERSDKYDKLFWETVGHVKVPVYDEPYIRHGADSVRIQLHAYFEQDRRASLMTVLISMLYGIVNGPISTN